MARRASAAERTRGTSGNFGPPSTVSPRVNVSRLELASARVRRDGATSVRALVGLVCAIAVADIVGNAWVSGAAQLPVRLVLAAAFGVWARRGLGLSWPALGLGQGSLRRGIQVGAGAALAVGAVIAVAAATSAAPSMFASSSVAGASALDQLLTPLLIIPIGTVLFEELIFRGVLLGALLQRTSRRVAAIASAAAFGLWHVIPALHAASGASAAHAVGVVMGTIALTAVAGIAFAWLRLRSGSLAAPVLAHIATNSLAYVAAVIVLR